ncbi:MAG: ATP synthase F0 subunit B [Spirulina sp. SIO3F2]|nr:ATP synthase F0 subunit B [Spirulina sp. SIO3F2]
MLQQDPPGNTQFDGVGSTAPTGEAAPLGFDVQAELNRLEELILDNPRIPFTGKTVINEEQLLDHLDVIRMNLPGAFEEAIEIIRQKEEILLQAEEYAQNIIENAQRQASQALDEMTLVRQAELEAAQVRQDVQQDSEQMRQQALAEIEQMRMQAMQELEQMRQVVLDECDDIQDGADDYADAVLGRLEDQLTEMMRVVRNGRRQLSSEISAASSASNSRPFNT